VSKLPEKIAQGLLLAVLFAVPALMAVHAACVTDPDVWWHLHTAEWMRANGGVPHADSFTRSIAGKPWADYSWLFERLVGWLHLRLGLAGIVTYTTALVFAITLALHRLVRRLQGDFSLGVLLTFAASFTMQGLYTPRPWLFTILFFAVVVDLTMQARTAGRMRGLLWLPAVFAVWANLHIQFVVGLAVVGVALLESLLARRWKTIETRAGPLPLLGALLASLAAACVNPYGWHIYRVVYDVATQPGGMDKISELQAMPFRELPQWLVLGFALGAVAVLAGARRILFFETAVLAFAVYFSFRSQRDVWVLVVVATAVLARLLPGRESNRSLVPELALPLVAVLSGLAVLVGFRVQHVDNRQLQEKLAGTMPVRAVEVVKQRGYAGPLYNDFNWGSYLMWSLEMPVVIDGRGSLYGDTRIDRSAATWDAEPDWSSDPQLTSARLVIGPVKAPLTQVLRLDPRWQLAYEDTIAAVFVARK